MAKYRNIALTFWTDSKVVDDFTGEDRFLFLHALTNPHTNLCGCYEISFKQIGYETGKSIEDAARIIKRLDTVHNVLRYNESTKEILILNWHRYNWSTSEKMDKPLLEEIRNVKCDRFRRYLLDKFNARGSVEKSVEGEVIKPTDKAAKGKQQVSTDAVFTLPLNDGTEYGITQEQIDKWSGLYPRVDIMQALRNMYGWLDADPARRKTRRGITRFVTSWLARDQDSGRNQRTVNTPYSRQRKVQPSSNPFLDLVQSGELDE